MNTRQSIVAGVAAAAACAGIVWGHGAAFADLPKLLADDGASGDEFGRSVAIDGEVGIVGAWTEDGSASNTGAAYLFDTRTGEQLHKLQADDGALADVFGVSVAIHGGLAVVGAIGDDDNGDLSGSAYLFDVATGQQLFKLLPDDGAANDRFGESVSISGDDVLVGARFADAVGIDSGAAYLFDAKTGQQRHKLIADELAARDEFGASVSVSGNYALVGAPTDDNELGMRSGAAYVFSVATGNQLERLLGTSPFSDVRVGAAVSASGFLAAVGAPKEGLTGRPERGAAYIYNMETGALLWKLIPADATDNDEFGNAIGISGDSIVVGTRADDDNGSQSGSAYLFDAETGQEISKLHAPDGAPFDEFGYSIAVSGGTALIGAPKQDESGSNAGAAYVNTFCELLADLEDDGVVDSADLGVLINQFGTAGPEADINGDGMVDTADLGLLIGAFGDDCP